MASNFRSNGTDLDDIIAPRDWFNEGNGLWSWGGGVQGTLGLGDVINRSSPVQVGSLTNWKQASAGSSQSLAVKTDGTLWSWGYNIFNGPLGLNDLISRSSPVQVGALTGWNSVSTSGGHTLARKA